MAALDEIWNDRSDQAADKAIGLPTLQLSNEGLGISLACTTVSASTALAGQGDTLCINNTGEVWVHLRFSTTASPTATVACWGCPPGAQTTLRMPGTNYVAGITAAGAATVQISRGVGN